MDFVGLADQGYRQAHAVGGVSRLTLNSSCFDDARQSRAFVAALKSRRLPLRFAYVGPAAASHARLVECCAYQLSTTESELIKTAAADLARSFGFAEGANVIDVGAGTGQKAVAAIAAFNGYFPTAAYVAIDYSQELLIHATRVVGAAYPRIGKIASVHLDFEECRIEPQRSLFPQLPRLPNLFLFLGHTLGNSSDRVRTLSNIANALSLNDKLVIGVELFDCARPSACLRQYDHEVFRDAVFAPLTFVGLTRRDGTLEVRFNTFQRDIESWFSFAHEVRISIAGSETASFETNDSILLGISHRFDLDEVSHLCSSVGLKVLGVQRDEARSYCLLVTQREDGGNG